MVENNNEIDDLCEFEIENPDLRFKIEPNEKAWELLWSNHKNIFEPFFVIPEIIIKTDELYNSRKSLTQQLRAKFQTYCKNYGHYNDSKNIERLTNKFVEYLALNLKQIPIKKISKTKKPRDKSTEVSDERKQESEAFLLSENKFKIIKEILDYYIVKEDKNKMLVFLLLSGAYSNNYQIIIVVGDSSGGKSHLGENIVALFPNKHTWTLTGASDKALIYKDWNSEKIVHIPEGQRNPEILENLKDFGDQGIIYNTVERNEENRFETREIVIGKLSVITTTTIDQLNSQLENRAWKIEPDLSKLQSEAIVVNTLKSESDLVKRMTSELKIKNYKNMLKLCIQTFEDEYDFDYIEMSFSEVLLPLLNYAFIKIRRDHKKFLALIKIITAWNYKIREGYEINTRKILLAHPNDLITAFQIGEEIFMNLTRNLTPEKKNILTCLDNIDQTIPNTPKKGKKKPKTLFSYLSENEQRTSEGKEGPSSIKTNDIYDEFCVMMDYKKSLKSFRNLLNSLSEDGYLEKEKKGRDNVYKLREGACFKTLSNEEIKNIYLQSFELYHHRKELLQTMENISFQEKIINLNKTEDLDLYSQELYLRLVDIFNENKTTTLIIDNLFQVLGLDYPQKFLEEEIYNMIKLGLFTKNFNNELIYEKKDGVGGEIEKGDC